MNRFPVLNLVSQLIKVVGWIVVGVGALAALSGGFGMLGFLPGFVAGLVIGVNGLIVVAAGESIGVLFAIEKNTRDMAQAASKSSSPTVSDRRVSVSDLAAEGTPL